MDSKIEKIQTLLDRELIKNNITQQVSIEISKNTPLKEKLNSILAILECSYGLKHTLLLFPNSDHTKMIVYASRGFRESGIGAEVPFGIGIVGMVAKKKKKIRLSGMRNYVQYLHAAANKPGTVQAATTDIYSISDVTLPGLPNVEAQLAFPLIANNELIAVLSIESDEKDFFSVDDEHFLHSLTQQMALSIQNALMVSQLEEKVHERTREIERQNAELELVNATKDKLFSIIGHDLKSPVTSLKVAADLIQHYSALGDTPKLNEIGAKVSTAVNNVNHLLDNLLKWAMSQRNLLKCEVVKVNVKELTGRVTDIFKESILAKEIEISNQIAPDCYIDADRDMAMVIFRNVLSNAIKFSQNQGQIEINGYCAEQRVCIHVVDHGNGMSEQKVKSLFNLSINKSTLGTNREKGTGLGMVLVSDFIGLNKGSVKVDSKPGLGTRVELCFPESRT
jgi:signal transduction histidine kinase